MEEWFQKRKWTFLNFCLAAFSFGLSLTVYYPTEYYYFIDLVQAPNPQLFYGLSWGFLCGSGVITSMFGSYYVDLTKNVRRISLVTCLLTVIGNVMYALYFSQFIVLFGQLLVGTGGARMVAAVGEVSRVYDTKEITSKLSFLGIFSAAGTVLGPSLTYVFKLVDIEIIGWKIKMGNMAGVTMAILFLIQFILNYFTLYNLSKECTLKAAASTGRVTRENLDQLRETETEHDEIEESIQDSYSEKNLLLHIEKNTPPRQQDKTMFQRHYVTALLTLVQQNHVMFLFSLCFFVTFAQGTVSLLAPIKTVQYLKWTEADIATFIIFSTCLGGIPTAILLTMLSKDVKDFFFCLAFLTTIIIMLILMALLPMARGNHLTLKVMAYCIGILSLSSNTGFQILSRSMIGKFVPENIQTVTEAIRNALFELSYMLSGLLVMISSQYMTQTMTIMAMIIIIHLAWYICEQRTFRNIQVMFLKEVPWKWKDRDEMIDENYRVRIADIKNESN